VLLLKFFQIVPHTTTLYEDLLLIFSYLRIMSVEGKASEHFFHLFTSKLSDFSGQNYSVDCSALHRGIIQAGINFLAIDFDLTLIDIHTNSKYQKSPNDLALHVRPFFKTFVSTALESGLVSIISYFNLTRCGSVGLKIAIVTFSSQISLIQNVLDIIFPGNEVTISISIDYFHEFIDPSSRG
jgi:hypothetical protein